MLTLRAPDRAEPLTPLSPPHSVVSRFRRRTLSWGRPDRAENPSVKMRSTNSNPRCLPSQGDARAHARTVADLERGHVMGFRVDPVLSVHSCADAALRFWRSLAACELDPRPCARPKSGEMGCARFSGSNAAWRLLQRNDYDARAPLERPILAAPWTLGSFGATSSSAFALASRATPFEGAQLAIAHPSRDRRAASHPSPSPFHPLALQACQRVERRRPPLFVVPLAGGTTNPLPVAPIEGWNDGKELWWVERPGAKDLPSPRNATPHAEVAKGSPPPRLFEHPMVIGLRVCREAGDSSHAHVSRPRPSPERLPAKGGARAKTGMLSAAGDPARDDYSPRYSPAVGLPLRRLPLSRDWHCRR